MNAKEVYFAILVLNDEWMKVFRFTKLSILRLYNRHNKKIKIQLNACIKTANTVF